MGSRARGFHASIKAMFALAWIGAACSRGSVDEAPAGTNFGEARLERWELRTSAGLDVGGETISTSEFAAADWAPVVVPSTVLGALVEGGAYPNVFHGTNLRNVPWADFDVSWWYRTSFEANPKPSTRTRLEFGGINYSANVWINGVLLGTRDSVFGAHQRQEFDITSHVRSGMNRVAVEVFAPNLNHDLSMIWGDWNPQPQDRNMGLFRPVRVKTSGPVRIELVRVASRVPTLDRADLKITARVINDSDAAVSADVLGSIGPTHTAAFETTVELEPGERRDVVFDPTRVPGLALQSPRLWWPSELGSPERYSAEIGVRVDGAESDVTRTSFGIREITATLNDDGNRQYAINGKPLLLRGGGWAQDMFLRRDQARLEAQLRYVRDLGLNVIRLEGQFESDAFLEICDREGILVLPGWMCCDAWQLWPVWTERDFGIARGSLETLARRYGNHPSVIDFLIGSDEAPTAPVEEMFLEVLNESLWPNPIAPSAADRSTPILGKSGFKMTGPYDWVPPSYWYHPDLGIGAARGFNSETGPGAAIPLRSSLEKMLAPDELETLWTSADAVHYHAGAGQTFSRLNGFYNALAGRWGTPTSLDDYVLKAQWMNYEAERAVYEAFARNQPRATGVIHWLLNNAWPSLIWHLYDYYLLPSAGYFGAKKGNEALHVQYAYDDRSVVVVRRSDEDQDAMSVVAQRFAPSGELLGEDFATFDLRSTVTRLFEVPAPLDGPPVYFVELFLRDADGTLRSRNSYWISTHEDVIDWENQWWVVAPTLQLADFRSLNGVAATTIETRVTREDTESATRIRLHVENRTQALAMLVHARIINSAGDDVVPITWTDNFVNLVPGESRELIGELPRSSDRALRVALDGWNVSEQDIEISP